MPPARRRSEIPYLRALFESGSASGLTDRELLERYVTREGDVAELAFAALVERHGAMVLRVCRGVLADSHDVQDAFQATFLVLVRRAGSIRKAESLAPWLHGVALRVASCARGAETRRRAHERAAASRPEAQPPDSAGPDLEGVIQEELAGLPDRYRIPLILCDLGGLTHEQAAVRIGCPVGTVKSRLSRGRERLRGRLARRGLGAAALSLGAAGGASAAVPSALAGAAVRLAGRGVPPGDLPAAVNALASAALRGQSSAWLGVALAMGLVAVLIAGAVAYARTAAPPNVGGVRIAAGAGRIAPARPVLNRTSIVNALREASRVVRRESDVSARLVTAVMIADAQARSGDKAGARETLGGVTNLAGSLPPPERATALTYAAWVRSAVGDAAGGLEDLRRASEAVAAIKVPWQRPHRLRWIAAAQLDLGDRVAAEATIHVIAEDAARQDPRIRGSATSTRLVEALADLGDFGAALAAAKRLGESEIVEGALLARMAIAASSRESSHMQPRKQFGPREREERLRALDRIEETVAHYQTPAFQPIDDLALARAQLGDFDGALRLARRLGEPRRRRPGTTDPTAAPFVLAMIGAAQRKAGQVSAADQTFRKALDLVANDAKLRPWLLQIASAQADSGDTAGALHTVEGMEPDGMPLSLANVARQCADAGDAEAARAIYKRALKEAEAIARGEAPLRPTAANGPATRPANAPDAVEQARDRARRDVATILAMMGDLEAADRAFTAIADSQSRMSAARSIVQARARAGDVDGALAWALALKEPGPRVGALAGLTDAVGNR